MEQIRKRMHMADQISTIYLIVSAIAVALEGYVLWKFLNSTEDLIGGIALVDPDSVVGGYEVLGRLFAGGLSAAAAALLFVLAVVTTVFLLVTLVQFLTGHFCARKIEAEEEALRSCLWINGWVKLISSVLICGVVLYAFGIETQAFVLLVPFLPEFVIVYCSARALMDLAQEEE